MPRGLARTLVLVLVRAHMSPATHGPLLPRDKCGWDAKPKFRSSNLREAPHVIKIDLRTMGR